MASIVRAPHRLLMAGCLLAVLALAGLCLAPATAQSVIANGSFETPDVGTGSASIPSTQTLGGWTSGLYSNATIVGNVPAATGKQCLQLGGPYYDTGSNVHQDNLPTVPRRTYTLRIAAVLPPGKSWAVVEVYWGYNATGGSSYGLIATISPSSAWHYWQIPVTAGGKDSVMFSEPGGIEVLVDDVCLIPPPAPPGDANNDGTVNLRDALLAVRLLTGVASPDPAAADRADIAPWTGTNGRAHGDGVLELADVAEILRGAGGLQP
jgi:hypothetical protein